MYIQHVSYCVKCYINLNLNHMRKLDINSANLKRD